MAESGMDEGVGIGVAVVVVVVVEEGFPPTSGDSTSILLELVWSLEKKEDMHCRHASRTWKMRRKRKKQKRREEMA